MSEQACQFERPKRRLLWKSLALTMSQASTLTGASERQIQHWMDQGYIVPATRGTRKINGDSLDLIVLIRQARRQGLPLHRAAELARRYLEDEAAGVADAAFQPSLLHDLRHNLFVLRSDLDRVEKMVGRADAERH